MSAQKDKEDDEDEDEIKANIAAIEEGGAAKSLVCNECGKKFRNADLASFHATKRQANLTVSSPFPFYGVC